MTQRNHGCIADARRYYQSLTHRVGSVAECVRKRKQRSASAPPAAPKPGRWLTRQEDINRRMGSKVRVPLGTKAKEMLDMVAGNYPRLREWSLGAEAAVIDKKYVLREGGSKGYINKRSTFQRGVLIQSYATCTKNVATLTLYGETYVVKAPRGYHWDIDANGLRLVGAVGDFHPCAGTLVRSARDRCQHLVGLLKQRAATRRENAKAQRAAEREARLTAQQRAAIIRRAELEGATVCLKDSLTAGNCYSGSESWARRHSLDPRGHYRPSELLAIANGDTARVALVVGVALRRHRHEMDRGYALLDEHRIN